MALTDKEVSIGSKDNVIRLIEEVRSRRFVPLAGLALGAQREQNFALLVQLHHRVRAHVRGPDVAILIDPETMATGKQSFAEGSNELPVLVELGDGLRAP